MSVEQISSDSLIKMIQAFCLEKDKKFIRAATFLRVEFVNWAASVSIQRGFFLATVFARMF